MNFPKVLALAVFTIVLGAGCFSASITINDSTPSEPEAKDTALAPRVTDLWSLKNPAALAAIGVTIGVALIALATFFFPVLTFKICYYLGGCQDSIDRYVGELVGDFDFPKRQQHKRSLDTYEPVITALLNAYEKYAESSEKKNFNIQELLTSFLS